MELTYDEIFFEEGIPVNETRFTVDYDPQLKKVVEIKEVWVYDLLRLTATNYREAAMKFMKLDDAIDDICDWHKLYADELVARKEEKELSAYENEAA